MARLKSFDLKLRAIADRQRIRFPGEAVLSEHQRGRVTGGDSAMNLVFSKKDIVGDVSLLEKSGIVWICITDLDRFSENMLIPLELSSRKELIWADHPLKAQTDRIHA